MWEGRSWGIRRPCWSAGRENQSLKKRSDGLSTTSLSWEKSCLISDAKELRRVSVNSPPLNPLRSAAGIPRSVELYVLCCRKYVERKVTCSWQTPQTSYPTGWTGLDQSSDPSILTSLLQANEVCQYSMNHIHELLLSGQRLGLCQFELTVS